ncbi:hypothetical protein SDC9_144909 [bioreactor metagenome]|uniref:Uncharacterized protein n=1 Tax=bioreactor metagenome TaxID=1076179 RepID=A0A645EAS9_9ZZZZ
MHLGGGAVDLVRKHEVGEDRAELDVERLLGCLIDASADDIRRHQVGSELEARERTADHGRERPHGQGLRRAGHALQQNVALRQQTGHQLFDHVLLTDDDPLHLRYCLSQDLGGILGGQRLLIA